MRGGGPARLSWKPSSRLPFITDSEGNAVRINGSNWANPDSSQPGPQKVKNEKQKPDLRGQAINSVAPLHLSAKRIRFKPEGRSPGFWLCGTCQPSQSGSPDQWLSERNGQALASYSGATTPDFHRLPFSAPRCGATFKLYSVVKVKNWVCR